MMAAATSSAAILFETSQVGASGVTYDHGPWRTRDPYALAWYVLMEA